MPWGAAIAAGGAILGGVISSDASKSSAHIGADAERYAADLSQKQYDQSRADNMPWHDAGATALGDITRGIGHGGEFDQTFSGMGDLSADPGYQFRMDQGMKGVQAGAAARGGVLSGGALKSLSDWNQEFASGEYQNAYNRFNTNQTNRFNRLATVAGIGQTANNALTSAGENNVNNQTSAIIGGANARSAGINGQASAINNGISTLGNWFQQQQMMRSINAPSSTPFSYSGGGVGTGGQEYGGQSYNNPSAYVAGGG